MLTEIVLTTLLGALAAGRCFTDNSTGTPLQLFLGSSGMPQCAPGFMCPGFNASDPGTFPVYCPPSLDCAAKRLFGDTCNAQGTYEPFLCSTGSFCKDGVAMLKCPAGFYCPIGSNDPIPCPALSMCPAGASTPIYLGGIVALVVACLAVYLVLTLYRRHRWAGSQSVLEPAAVREHLCDGFARRRGGAEPLNIVFKDLQVAIDIPAEVASYRDYPVSNPFASQVASPVKEKVLLSNASGSIPSGKLVAIMGPSGCGKTTLLNALLGRLGSGPRVTGSVSIRSPSGSVRAVSDNVASSLGFVPQVDVLHEELSVFSNVYYSSELRLPRDWTAAERQTFRNAVLSAMGLDDVRDVRIGDSETRGVSGGQRKRASIAVELGGAPLALFLDEPTSGLDAATALSVCESLKSISVGAMIPVVMVIHQPRLEIWRSIDTLLLLAPGGRTVYEGPREDLERHLLQVNDVAGGTAQFPGFSPDLNPADVVMDFVSRHPDELVALWERRKQPVLPAATVSSSNELPRPAMVAYEDTQVVTGDRPAASSSLSASGPSLLRQVVLVHVRCVEKQANQTETLLLELIVMFLTGAVMGSVMLKATLGGYYQHYKLVSPEPLVQLLPQFHMYTLMSISIAAASSGVHMFVNDRLTLRREMSSGVTSSAIFIGTATAYVYRLLLATLMFCTVAQLLAMRGFPFSTYFCLIMLSYFAMYGIAAICAVVVRQEMAALVAMAVCVGIACTNGFIPYPRILCKLFFAFWMSQAEQELIMAPVAANYEDTLAPWGWENGRKAESLAIMFVMGIAYFFVAFFLFRSRHVMAAK
jgi:ABC-type multidrug transport system ATPase subunit